MIMAMVTLVMAMITMIVAMITMAMAMTTMIMAMITQNHGKDHNDNGNDHTDQNDIIRFSVRTTLSLVKAGLATTGQKATTLRVRFTVTDGNDGNDATK